jgi:uncharacterized protein (DUF2252 family)
MEQAAKATSHALEFEKLAIRSRPEPGIRDQQTLICHLDDERGRHFRDDVAESFRRYKETAQPAVAALLDRYRLVDVAMTVVGVGSVGKLCAMVLLMSGSGDPLILQVKEARRSVLEPYAGASPVAHPGECVVRGRRLMQGASDMFLGWLVAPGAASRPAWIASVGWGGPAPGGASSGRRRDSSRRQPRRHPAACAATRRAPRTARHG